MSSDSNHPTRLAATQALGAVWWYFLTRSILMFVVGAFMLFTPDISLVTFTQVIAALILIDGVMALVAGFTGEAQSRRWSITRGLLMAGAGAFIFAQPALVSSVAIKTVLYIIAPFVILSGVFEITGALRGKYKHSGKKGGFFSGLLTTLFGILLIIAPVFFGVLLVQILGIITILMAFALLAIAIKFRKLKQEVVTT